MTRPPTRRRQARVLCSDLAQVSFYDHRGRRIQEIGVLEDLGRNGARLSLSLPLTVGRQIKLRTTGFSVSAGVRYCELADAGYAVGLEFSADTQWDGHSWTPEHLLRIPSREHSA